MSGLVLLDEEQHRTLLNMSSHRGSGPRQQQPKPKPQPPYPGRASETSDILGEFASEFASSDIRGSGPRADFTSFGGPPSSPITDFRSRPTESPKTDFRAGPGGSPRTDFRSRAAGPARTDFRSRVAGSPRTDFTSRAPRSPRTDFTSQAAYSPRTDFTTNQGLPRTDFTTGSGGKPSVATFSSSSPRTNFTREAGYPLVHEGLGPDSYPILRQDSDMVSSNEDTDSDGVNKYAGTSTGLKISVRWILAGVLLGVALGVVLSHLEADDVAAQWVSLPGDLFLRALKCLVIPYIFCAVAVSVGDIVFVGKVSIVGVQTAKIFAIMWVTTTTMGVAVALLFRPLFRLHQNSTVQPLNAMGFTCPNNLAATMLPNDTISCVGNITTLVPAANFVVHELNTQFTTNVNTAIEALSLSDQLMQMITPFVSSNILGSMANGDALSVITFSMVLGSIAGRSYFTKSRRTNYLYLTLLQSRNALFMMMEWTIWLSPVAVISIIAGSFATNQKSMRELENAYVYVLGMFTAAMLQTLVLFPAIVFLLTRCNPYAHMRQMVRAYIFAFACSSSLATAPVTLTCVKKSRVCSQSLANFVISIGVTSNISAIGFYIPIAVIFLAESSGNGDQITVLRLVGIFVLSLLSCTGTPPIPSAGLATITTVYTTIFGVTQMPATFPYVVAMDFLLDRFATVGNVNDDIMALKVIAENTDETVAQDHLGERY